MSRTLATPSPARTRTISLNDDGTLTVQQTAGSFPAGTAITIEAQNPVGGASLYTVPAGKTFTGTAVLNQTVPGGTLGIACAAGISQPASPPSITGVGLDTVDVVIPGGGAGNAVTVQQAGGGQGVLLLTGYVK